MNAGHYDGGSDHFFVTAQKSKIIVARVFHFFNYKKGGRHCLVHLLPYIWQCGRPTFFVGEPTLGPPLALGLHRSRGRSFIKMNDKHPLPGLASIQKYHNP